MAFDTHKRYLAYRRRHMAWKAVKRFIREDALMLLAFLTGALTCLYICMSLLSYWASGQWMNIWFW